ncbi:MAG: hypothetical protein ACJAWL_000375 [Motiliproteus sp.]|jgi:hypothetical protein
MRVSLLRIWMLLFAAMLLTACGGGTGDGGSTGGGAGSGAAVSKSPSLSLTLLDSLGSATTAISESQSGTLSALVLSAAGVPVTEKVVNFTLSNAAIGVLDPSSGSALTNTSGVASITLKAGSSAGAATATATAVVDSDSVTGNKSFSTNLANIALGSGSGGNFVNRALTASIEPPTELSAGGTMSITATVVDQSDGNSLFTSPVEVSFSSGCVADSTALIDATVSTVNGVATATYRADGCEGADTITATAAGGSSATVGLLVAAASAGSIEFDSSTPSNIAIKGTGRTDRPESSVVKFVIKDVNGKPAASKLISFSLNNTLGGLSLSPASATSNSLGEVQTTVHSGTVQATVRVIAEHDLGGSTISTVSDNLVVSVGLPDSDSISLSLSSHNPESGNRDGVEVDATVHLADHFNVVVEGTTVTFISENGGAMAPSSCVTGSKGSCSVKWISGGTRPGNGKVSILAFMDGEESFSDLNGSGYFDDSERGTVDQLPEAYLDEDEDGQFDASEPYFDIDGDAQYSTADSLFNGALCTAAAETNFGHCVRLVHVRASQTLVAATSTTLISISPASPIDLANGSQSVSAMVTDQNGNSPAGGSTVAFSTTAGVLSGQTSFTVPDHDTGPYSTLSVTLTQGGSNATGSLTVTVTTPNERASSKQSSVINAAAP